MYGTWRDLKKCLMNINTISTQQLDLNFFEKKRKNMIEILTRIFQK